MSLAKQTVAFVDRSRVGSRSEASIEAIELVYRRRFHEFVRVAQAITRSRESAVDAVQEGFAAALRSRRAFRGDGPLEAWIWRAVVNAALRSLRGPVAAEFDVPEPAAENGGRADDELRAVIASLPERQRLVLFLRYYADLDYRSIATALELEIGTVSATLNQAHGSLRRLLVEVAE